MKSEPSLRESYLARQHRLRTARAERQRVNQTGGSWHPGDPIGGRACRRRRAQLANAIWRTENELAYVSAITFLGARRCLRRMAPYGVSTVEQFDALRLRFVAS